MVRIAPVATPEELPDMEVLAPSALAVLQGAEVEQQIATAKRYPRNITAFVRETAELATLNEFTAKECMYALPRDGKVIEGPSVRMAEILAHSWGNCRAGARVVDEGEHFITAQGFFYDLEKNVAVTLEVRRRITNSKGKRFGADMIGVTGNAACSIAFRNAVTKGIPKALWSEPYAQVRKVVAGDSRTLANRRDEAIKAFTVYGVKPEQLFTALDVEGLRDIGVEHLIILGGMLTTLKDGEMSAEEMFPEAAARPRKEPAKGSRDKPGADGADNAGKSDGASGEKAKDDKAPAESTAPANAEEKAEVAKAKPAVKEPAARAKAEEQIAAGDASGEETDTTRADAETGEVQSWPLYDETGEVLSEHEKLEPWVEAFGAWADKASQEQINGAWANNKVAIEALYESLYDNLNKRIGAAVDAAKKRAQQRKAAPIAPMAEEAQTMLSIIAKADSAGYVSDTLAENDELMEYMKANDAASYDKVMKAAAAKKAAFGG